MYDVGISTSKVSPFFGPALYSLLSKNFAPLPRIFFTGPRRLTSVVKKYGPISITGPPPS